MQQLIHLLLTYKWSIGLGLFMFIFCLMILNFGIAVTFLVLIFTALAVWIGLMRDRNISFADLFRNMK